MLNKRPMPPSQTLVHCYKLFYLLNINPDNPKLIKKIGTPRRFIAFNEYDGSIFINILFWIGILIPTINWTL